MLSNRVKRNISATLMVLGISCIIGRGLGVMMTPKSVHAWFELCGILLLTYLCFDKFMIYRRRVKRGIMFGNLKKTDFMV